MVWKLVKSHFTHWKGLKNGQLTFLTLWLPRGADWGGWTKKNSSINGLKLQENKSNHFLDTITSPPPYDRAFAFFICFIYDSKVVQMDQGKNAGVSSFPYLHREKSQSCANIDVRMFWIWNADLEEFMHYFTLHLSSYFHIPIILSETLIFLESRNF